MTRFKAKIWKSGTSSVVTIPAPMIGVDYRIGDEVVVEIQNPLSQISTGNLQSFGFEGFEIQRKEVEI